MFQRSGRYFLGYRPWDRILQGLPDCLFYQEEGVHGRRNGLPDLGFLLTRISYLLMLPPLKGPYTRALSWRVQVPWGGSQLQTSRVFGSRVLKWREKMWAF